MRAPARTFGIVLALTVVTLGGVGSTAFAQCAAQIDVQAKAWFEATVAQGVETVPIYVDSDGAPISNEFQAALEDAVKQWKSENDDGETVGTCSGSEHVPKFEVKFGSRPVDPPPAFTDIREAALGLDYKPGIAPPFDDEEGTLTLASHDPNTNVITVYGKCPTDASSYGIPCNDATGTIDWVNPERYGQKVLAHELGHALNLAHDTCDNSVMQEQLGLSQFGGAVLANHCTKANETNSDKDHYSVTATFSCVGASEQAFVTFTATEPDGDPVEDVIYSLGGDTRASANTYKEGTVIENVSAEIGGNTEAKSCSVSPQSATLAGDLTLSVTCSCTGASSSSAIFGEYLLGRKGTCDASCDLDDPIPDLEDRCNIAPATCYGEDPYGGEVPHYYTTCWRITQTYSTTVEFENGTRTEVYWVIESTQCKDGFVVYATPADGSVAEDPDLMPKVVGQTAGEGPMTAILAPEADEVVSGTVELSGFARDDAYGTGQVALWIDNQLAPVQNLTWGESYPEGCVDLPDAPASGCNPNMGWSATLDTTQLSNGTHKLQVVSVSGRGDEWPPVTYTETTFQVENCLDETKPSVTLDSPVAGEELTGLVNVAGTFDDNVGVTRADLLVDGNLVATDTSEPFGFSWDSSTVAIGEHTLRVRGRDECGNWGYSSPVTVSVWNPIPGGAAIRVQKAYGDLAQLSAGSTVTYPDVDEGSAISRLFTIMNDGDTTLELSNPSNLVSGACWHQISPFPTASIPSGESTSFRVRLLCGDYGSKTGTVTIQSNDPDDSSFQFSTQGTVRAPDIRVARAYDDSTVNPGATIQFGSIEEGTSKSKRFALHNEGNADLVLSNPTSLVSGTCFHQIENPSATVKPGETTYFRVRLSCGTAGTYTGSVSISSNDSDESPYTFSTEGTVTEPPPDIRVAQAWNGSTVGQGTVQQFPTVDYGASTSRRYAIHNDGNGTLSLTNRTSLVSATCFQQIETPSSSVAPGGTTYFRVRLYCTSAGTHTGTVSIASNDPDENPYTFSVRGTVRAPADIRVSRAWNGVTQGIGTTFTFPTVDVGTSVSRRFAIHNDGGSTLYIGNSTSLVSGSCWYQIETPSSTVYPGGTTYVRVRLYCNSGGSYLGTVSISSNDPNEDPYWFRVSGTVEEPPPDISVAKAWNGQVIGNGGSFTYPSVTVGTAISRRFAISNSGTGNLDLSNATSLVSGTCWHQIETPTDPIAPGGTGYVRVRLHCNNAGSYTGYLTIYSNDPDENPYRITLYGTVTQ